MLKKVGFIFKNDIWVFKPAGNQWEQLETSGVFEVPRQVRLWDGAFTVIKVLMNETIESDIPAYTPYNAATKAAGKDTIEVSITGFIV